MFNFLAGKVFMIKSKFEKVCINVLFVGDFSRQSSEMASVNRPPSPHNTTRPIKSFLLLGTVYMEGG